MSGWLERQGNYLFGSGDNSLLGDVEKGFENIGRVKVTDLSEESKSELGKYFDWKESADNEMYPAFDPLSEEDSKNFSRYEELGWRREKNEDGEWEYSRDKTTDEKLDALSEGLSSFSEKDQGQQRLFSETPRRLNAMGAGSRRGYGTEVSTSPYDVPTYLESSANYDKEVKSQLKGLLASPAIRNILIRSLV